MTLLTEVKSFTGGQVKDGGSYFSGWRRIVTTGSVGDDPSLRKSIRLSGKSVGEKLRRNPILRIAKVTVSR